MRRNPYNQYHETKILGADQGRLILMAYDGAIKFLQIAIDKLENKDYIGKGKNIIQAQELINELLCSLNYEAGDIAFNLRDLYIFMIKKLIYAETWKDKEAIKDVLKILYELQDAWEKIILNAGKESSAIITNTEVTEREAVL